jgi:hypothetical protein
VIPFTDHEGAKQRPAIIVSSAAYNTERPDAVLIAVTIRIKYLNVNGKFYPLTRIAGKRLAELAPARLLYIMPFILKKIG